MGGGSITRFAAIASEIVSRVLKLKSSFALSITLSEKQVLKRCLFRRFSGPEINEKR